MPSNRNAVTGIRTGFRRARTVAAATRSFAKSARAFILGPRQHRI